LLSSESELDLKVVNVNCAMYCWFIILIVFSVAFVTGSMYSTVLKDAGRIPKRKYLQKVNHKKRQEVYRFKRRVFNKEGNEEVGKEVPEEDEGMEGDKEERLDEENEYGDVQYEQEVDLDDNEKGNEEEEEEEEEKEEKGEEIEKEKGEEEEEEEEEGDDDEFLDMDSSFLDDSMASSDSERWSTDDSDDSDSSGMSSIASLRNEEVQQVHREANKVVMEIDGTLINVLNGWYLKNKILDIGPNLVAQLWQPSIVTRELLPDIPLYVGGNGTSRSLSVDIMSFLNEFTLTLNQRNKMERALMMVSFNLLVHQ
jgi:hypothetical protein